MYLQYLDHSHFHYYCRILWNIEKHCRIRNMLSGKSGILFGANYYEGGKWWVRQLRSTQIIQKEKKRKNTQLNSNHSKA